MVDPLAKSSGGLGATLNRHEPRPLGCLGPGRGSRIRLLRTDHNLQGRLGHFESWAVSVVDEPRQRVGV